MPLSEEERQRLIKFSMDDLRSSIKIINSEDGIAKPEMLGKIVTNILSKHSPYVSNLLLGTISEILAKKGNAAAAREVTEYITHKPVFAEFTDENPDDAKILLENLLKSNGDQEKVFNVLIKPLRESYPDKIGGKKKRDVKQENTENQKNLEGSEENPEKIQEKNKPYFKN